MAMELKIKEYEQPKQIEFNFDELKKELEARAKEYETIVYGEDQIKQAKEDRAQLNKFKKALNDERLKREREYMEPFNDFKQKVNLIISIIDKPIYVIDKQVKDWEKDQKDKKKKEIEAMFAGLEGVPEWVKLEKIFDEKWLNASTSMKSVQEDVQARLEGIKKDLETLSNLPQFAFEATETYKGSLNLNVAISEGMRLSEIQRRKEEQERLRKEAEERERQEKEAAKREQEHVEASEQPEPAKDEPRRWIGFSANLTFAQALELRDFFETRGIEFRKIDQKVVEMEIEKDGKN